MDKLKRGVFYTLAGFFLVSLVLFLSILLTITINQSNQRLTEAGGFERIIAMDDSIIKLLKDLEDGIDITLEEIISENESITNLVIIESPNQDFANYGNTFYINLQNLRDYIESDQSEIKFDINKVYNTTNKINFLIKPDNLQYTHIQEKSSNGTLIEIIAPPTLTNSIISINLNNYQVNSSNLITWSLQNSGAFNITILLTDDVNYLETLNASIDIDNNNTFTINYNSQTAEVNVGEYCLRCITIDRGGFNITSEFSTNLDYLGETVTVNYPQGTYTMDFINLNILVNKTPRML